MIRLIFILFLGICTFSTNGNLVTNLTQDVNEHIELPVYSFESSEYLKSAEVVPSKNKVEKKYARHKASFNLPDTFYFFGAPIFLIILLRIIAAFIKNFEDDRKEEIKRQEIKLVKPE